MQSFRGTSVLLTHVLGTGHLLQCLAVGKCWPVSRGGLFRGSCLLLAVCEGEGRRLVVTSVRGGRAVQKMCFEIWREKKRFSSASHSTLHDNTISKVTFRNPFTPKGIREAILNNNRAVYCAWASFSSFCHSLREAEWGCSKRSRNNALWSQNRFFSKREKNRTTQYCECTRCFVKLVHMCRSMCLAEGVRVAASLHTVDSPHRVKRKP